MQESEISVFKRRVMHRISREEILVLFFPNGPSRTPFAALPAKNGEREMFKQLLNFIEFITDV
jgi:hypothetical protein